MPRYIVEVTKTTTLVETVKVEVSASDEVEAGNKILTRIQKAVEKGTVFTAFDWKDQPTDGKFEYEVSEA